MAQRRQSSQRKKRQLTNPHLAANPAVISKPATFLDMVLSRRFRFVIAFALFSIALYAAIQVLPPSFTHPIDVNTARTLGIVLNAFGIPVSAAEDTVSGEWLAFRIVPECTPIFTVGLFLSFVIFYPAPLRGKATGLFMGIPALYLGNIARLAATFMISRYDRKLFDVVHVYLGQVFTISLVIVVCIGWLRGLDQKASKQSIPLKAAGFLVRFAVISGGLFLVWTQIHHSYIRLLDRIMTFGFSLFGYRVALAQHTVFYYETFSIVCFTSLVLAVRSISWLTKIKGLAAGLGVLFLMHLFHRIDNASIAYFNFTSLLPVDLTLLVVGQYLLPVLFLILMVTIEKQEL